MITYQLPRKIRLVPASGIFVATFGTPTVGKYDFNGQIVPLAAQLIPNSVYLIDSLSIAGTVASETFLNAIDTVPALTIMKTLEKENIFDAPLQIHAFWTDRQIVHFFKTGQNNTGLAGKLVGALNMTPELVGIGSVTLSINLTLHAIDASEFERMYVKGQ